MVPVKKGDKIIFKCPKCGYEAQTKENSVTLKDSNVNKKDIVVFDNKNIETLPKTTDVVCPRCGNHEAYYWTIQTRASDEAETRFFRCTKCGYTWREYD